MRMVSSIAAFNVRLISCLAAVALLSCGAIAADENAPASAKPTVIDLCKAGAPAEAWPECKSGAFGNLTREVNSAFTAAVSRLSAVWAVLLKRDQVWFREMLETHAGEVAADNADEREPVERHLKRRAEDLTAMRSGPRDVLAGWWANAFGAVEVVAIDGGYRIEVATGTNYGSDDARQVTCETKATVRAAANGWLTGVADTVPDKPSKVPVPVRLRQQGETLRLIVGEESQHGPHSPEANCGGANQLTGTYFAAEGGKAVKSPSKVGLAARPSPVMPSFDCRKPESASEEEICADPELAANDVRLNAAWKVLLPRLDPATQRHLIADQKKWLQAQAAQLTVFLHPAWDKRASDLHQTGLARDQLAFLQRERIALIEGFDQGRKGFAGLWVAYNAMLAIEVDSAGKLASNGRKWEQGAWKDYCTYEMSGSVRRGVFETNEKRVNPDTLEREGVVLVVNRKDDAFSRNRGDQGRENGNEPKCRRTRSMSSTSIMFPVKPSPDIDTDDGRIR